MLELIKDLSELKDTPVPVILVSGGVMFLLLALAGGFSGKIEIPAQRQKWAGMTGFFLLIFGTVLYMLPAPSALATPTQVISSIPTNMSSPSPAPPTNTLTSVPHTDTPTPEPLASTPYPTAIPAPRIYDFSACPNPCTGNNASRGYPEGTTKIYAQWRYENIPVGSHFVRAWTMDGREWIRYDCIWPGPESGMSAVELREPSGMHSGTWEVTISVDGEVLLREQISVEGNWRYWSPAGVRNQCFETVPN